MKASVVADDFASRLKGWSDTVKATLIERHKMYADSYLVAGEMLRYIFPNGISPEQYGVALKMAETIQIFRRIAANPKKLDSYVDWAGWADLAGMEFTAEAGERK